MIEEQNIEIITVENLKARVEEFHKNKHRLVQISATVISETYELNYSFDKDYKFDNLRIVITEQDQEIPSISGIYWNAMLYENELHDLFGLNIKDIAIDYKGKFYLKKKDAPFAFSKKDSE